MRNLKILKINILLRINYNFQIVFQLKTLHNLKLKIVKLYKTLASRVSLRQIYNQFLPIISKVFINKMIKVKKNNKIINKKKQIFLIIMVKI